MCVCHYFRYILMSVFILHFFFFKQKTAYEMRISDWSSDVCSSDLVTPSTGCCGRRVRARMCQPAATARRSVARPTKPVAPVMARMGVIIRPPLQGRGRGRGPSALRKGSRPHPNPFPEGRGLSEIGRAHVELQSLMRISYAVFCLKKKKT